MSDESKSRYTRYLNFFIVILMIVVIAVAVRNKIRLEHYSKEYETQKEWFSQWKQNVQKIQDALIKAQSSAINHQGSILKFINMELIFPSSTHSVVKPMAKHPRLILVFSELSCNTCQDSETQFGIGIANEYGTDYVMAVIYATERNYVANYVRMNQVNFPVFFCEDETFFKENKINNTPMIFVIDEKNQIIASHFPLPGHLEFSEPIHRFCYHYFNLNYPSRQVQE